MKRGGKYRARKRKGYLEAHIQLVDLDGPILDRNFGSPAGKRGLILQDLCDMSHDHMGILVLHGALDLAMRPGHGRHGPADVGDVCRIHIRSPSNGELGINPRETLFDASIR